MANDVTVGDEFGQDVVINDAENPRSVVSLVPPVVAERISQVPKDYLVMDERSLKEELIRSGKRPSPMDNRARIAFWIEYNNAQNNGRSMFMTNVYGGVCSREHFYNALLTDKQRTAWLVCPPTQYLIAMEEMLSFGMDRVRDEILTLPVVNKKGEPNPRMAQVILDAVKMIDQRIKGAVIQRVETKNLHVHAGKSQMDKGSTTVQGMSELDKKLDELEKRARGVLQGKPMDPSELVIDAEVVTEDNTGDGKDADL